MKINYKTTRIILFNKNIKLNKKLYIKNFQIVIEFLNKKKKLIFICNPLSCNHHSVGIYLKNLKNKGWGESIYNIFYKKFKNINIINITNIGTHYGASNPNNKNPFNNKLYEFNFLKIKYYNWIKIFNLTLKNLKINKLFIIIGSSFGGMQSLLWNIIYPKYIKNLIIIASCSKMSLKNIIYNKINKISIINNYKFLKNKFFKYKIKNLNGLKLTRIIGNLTYLSKFDLKKKLKLFLYKKNYKKYKKKLKLSKYFCYQSNKFIQNFKINSYLLIIKLINSFKFKKLKNLKNLNKKKKFLILNFKNDSRFNNISSIKINKLLIKNYNKISLKTINNLNGHDSFLKKIKNYLNIIKNYTNYLLSE